MIDTEKLITADSMSRQASSTAYFRDTSPPSQSPQRSITQADNKVRVQRKDFITESFEVRGELCTQVSR